MKFFSERIDYVSDDIVLVKVNGADRTFRLAVTARPGGSDQGHVLVEPTAASTGFIMDADGTKALELAMSCATTYGSFERFRGNKYKSGSWISFSGPVVGFSGHGVHRGGSIKEYAIADTTIRKENPP